MADDGLNERDVVNRVCAGRDEDAANRLYQLCHSVALRLYYTLRISGQCSPDDLAHDLFVFLAANDCEKLKTWEGRSSLNTWVQAVAIRLFRRGASRQARAKPLTDKQSDELQSRDDEPSEAAIRAMSVSAILKAMDELADADRKVILMWFNGHSPAEIAEILGIAPGTVRTRKHRALERLRAILQAGGLANV